MTRWIRTVALGLLALALLAPAPATAETIRFAHGTLGATAVFRSLDSTGCVYTETFISAQDERRKDGAGPQTDVSSVMVTISQADQCTGEILLAAQGSAPLAPDAFTIDGLETAWLSAPVEVADDLTGSAFTVNIAVGWSGDGEPYRSRLTTQIWTEAFSVTLRVDGTDRYASATGSVTDGSNEYAPSPATEAGLREYRAGQLTVTRNG